MNPFIEDILVDIFGSGINAREELERVHSITTRLHERQNQPTSVEPGISVILPAYKSKRFLPKVLKSLYEQSLDHDLFEVIVITNGPDDGSTGVINSARVTYPELNLRHIHAERASAGYARNIGIRLASREYGTFVDADDTLQPDFLSTAYSVLRPDTVVLAPIYNVSEEGSVDTDTPLMIKMRRARGTSKVVQHPWALGFNACKFVRTALLRENLYNTELRSGEDLVYFAGLLRHPELHVTVLPEDNNAYLRLVTESSVSRGDNSFDFMVRQRLDCVAALREIPVETGSPLACRRSLESAQFGFVSRYLGENPDDRDHALRLLAQRRILDFPWQQITAGKAKDLVISYCFPPYSDTAAIVAAKAVRERGRIVDVISNNMSQVRWVDPSTTFLVDHLLDERIIVDSPVSFAGWDQISEFAARACSAAEERARKKGTYETVYSRALWVGSHAAAALYKLRHPGCVWSAEFSDPLCFDAEGKPRPGDYKDDYLAKQLKRALRVRGVAAPEGTSLFKLLELVTFCLADELIFTNSNQCEYMLKPYSDDLRKMVREKARIRHHPTPPPEAYEVLEPSYPLDHRLFNIGYFGSFYPNRGIGDVIHAMEQLSPMTLRQMRLHLFTTKPADVEKQLSHSPVRDIIHVNPYLPYMEFLSTVNQFNLLVVNDVQRSLAMEINPFLPSKYSDYKGSSAKVWAIVDEGSPLEKMPVDFKSPLFDYRRSAAVLETAIEQWRSATNMHHHRGPDVD